MSYSTTDKMPKSLRDFNLWKMPLPLAVVFGIIFINDPDQIEHMKGWVVYTAFAALLLGNASMWIGIRSDVKWPMRIIFSIYGSLIGAVCFYLMLGFMTYSVIFYFILTGGKIGG